MIATVLDLDGVELYFSPCTGRVQDVTGKTFGERAGNKYTDVSGGHTEVDKATRVGRNRGAEESEIRPECVCRPNGQ